MRKILIAVLMSAVILTVSSCSISKKPTDNSNRNTQSESYIERAAKNIVIKGYSIEIPFKLGSLNDGWTYELMAEPSENGLTGADILYNGEWIYSANVENCFDGSEDDGIVYYIALENENGSIDGITPFKTTKSEVLDKYGEPNHKQSHDSFESYWYTDSGTSPPVNFENNTAVISKSVLVSFEGEQVRCISVSCSDASFDLESIGG